MPTWSSETPANGTMLSRRRVKCRRKLPGLDPRTHGIDGDEYYRVEQAYRRNLDMTDTQKALFTAFGT